MTIVTVTREWDDVLGNCYDCGAPAAYALPDAYGPDHALDEVNLRCSTCAAFTHAMEGEPIVYLWMEEEDGPTEAQKRVINHYLAAANLRPLR